MCEEPSAFDWCISDPDNPGARWRFELQPLMGGGTRIITNRLQVHRTNMQRVVNGLKAHVEVAAG